MTEMGHAGFFYTYLMVSIRVNSAKTYGSTTVGT